MAFDPEITAAWVAGFIEIFVKPAAEKGAELIGDAKNKFVDYPDAARVYRERLIDLYSKQRMLGKPDEMSISDLFTDVYMLEKQTASRRFDIEQLREYGESRRGGEPGERMRGFPLVAKGTNLYILGKPGAGKTTFLKYIAMQAAKGDLPKVPIFVSLNDWSNSPHGKAGQEALIPYIVEQFDICHFPDAEPFIKTLLTSGRALILFDGLDEVRKEDNQRLTLTRLLKNFAKKYNECQCLITCRIAASDSMFDNFRDVEVADFTPEQVDTYAEKWFADFPHKLDLFKADLAKAENEGLAELCRSPLLLGMLCLYFDDAQAFPKRRGELYEEAIEALLKKWDSSRDIQRDYQALSARRKQQMFASIAAQTFGENEYFVKEKRLVKLIEEYLARILDVPDDIDGYEVLKAIEAQHGIFVERAVGIYSFAHLTFQEYFAARYIVENEARGTVANLAQKHLTDPRWREVFLLTADMLEDGDDFVAQMRQRMDGYVADDSGLMDLLTWAGRKVQTATVQDESRRVVIRLAYVFLALSPAPPLAVELEFALNIALDITPALDIAPALDRALDLARTLEFALELDPELDPELAHDIAHKSASDLVSVRDLVSDIAKNLNEDVGVDFGLLYAWQYASIFGVIDEETREQLAKQMDEYTESFYPQMIDFMRAQNVAPELCEMLETLTVPAGQDEQVTWQEFADALAKILMDQRDFIFRRRLSVEQSEKMIIYFEANEWLVQCLDLATVLPSTRAEIKAGLLLPPRSL